MMLHDFLAALNLPLPRFHSLPLGFQECGEEYEAEEITSY
jgi:hypothetical protein